MNTWKGVNRLKEAVEVEVVENMEPVGQGPLIDSLCDYAQSI